MRLAAVTTLALALAIPASAEAAPIRECGDYNMDTGRSTRAGSIAARLGVLICFGRQPFERG